MIRHSNLRSTEVSRDQLEDLAYTRGSVIDLPGNRAGWAYVVLPDGRRFHAWLPAPAEEGTPMYDALVCEGIAQAEGWVS